MIEKINHLSFTVSNLDKSIKFYSEILGLRVVDVSSRGQSFSEKVVGVKGAELKIAYLDGVTCFVELIEYVKENGNAENILKNNDTGSAHICFNVSDFDDIFEKVKKTGAEICGEVCVVPNGPNKGKRVVYFKDPDNNTLEFIEI